MSGSIAVAPSWRGAATSSASPPTNLISCIAGRVAIRFTSNSDNREKGHFDCYAISIQNQQPKKQGFSANH